MSTDNAFVDSGSSPPMLPDLSTMTLADLEAREADLHRSLAEVIAAKAQARPAPVVEPHEPDRSLTPAEAGAVLGISAKKILAMARVGTVPSTKVSHKVVRFRERDLRRWISARSR